MLYFVRIGVVTELGEFDHVSKRNRDGNCRSLGAFLGDIKRIANKHVVCLCDDLPVHPDNSSGVEAMAYEEDTGAALPSVRERYCCRVRPVLVAYPPQPYNSHLSRGMEAVGVLCVVLAVVGILLYDATLDEGTMHYNPHFHLTRLWEGYLLLARCRLL